MMSDARSAIIRNRATVVVLVEALWPGGIDLGGIEVEIDVAAGVEALGQGERAVADPAGVRDRLATERAIDDQPEILGFRVARGDGLEVEAMSADGPNG